MSMKQGTNVQPGTIPGMGSPGSIARLPMRWVLRAAAAGVRWFDRLNGTRAGATMAETDYQYMIRVSDT